MHDISRKIRADKDDLDKIDDWLTNELKILGDDDAYRVHMAATELIENAVKYHRKHGITESILLRITMNGKLTISVTNTLEHPGDAGYLMRHIGDIAQGDDPNHLYMIRLKEIIEHRVPGENRLGLLRIASEGNFELNCSVSGTTITVTAEKIIPRKRTKSMDSLIRNDFSIILTEGNPVTVQWQGRSRDLNPAHIIDDYLNELSDYLIDREVIIDFSTMESMNSSTIPPILGFLTQLEKKRIRATVRYSQNSYWQNASFKPLSVLIRDFRFVKISPE